MGARSRRPSTWPSAESAAHGRSGRREAPGSSPRRRNPATAARSAASLRSGGCGTHSSPAGSAALGALLSHQWKHGSTIAPVRPGFRALGTFGDQPRRHARATRPLLLPGAATGLAIERDAAITPAKVASAPLTPPPLLAAFSLRPLGLIPRLIVFQSLSLHPASPFTRFFLFFFLFLRLPHRI